MRKAFATAFDTTATNGLAWAVIWVVVVDQKIAIPFSNSFYAVFCLIVVHIPNFIQIGQKDWLSLGFGWLVRSFK